ncbi:metallophosphoesterase family protein [Methylobacterium oryzihabitans]|uniref:Metallophosphoesterase n=1 Tax=Methylobacterium oryzihabitans TaxID=2499852 RepID=A0A3S2YS53_9HYPH|nr:metallophosphoesterase [Methylobacterium oryzihabitans]RVU17850.1 metallophosphoesterase [Methylobacterium oryzihabitans]
MTANPPGEGDPFVLLHVGDLHLTTPEAASARDLDAILARIAGLPRAAFDFAYLPGDIAEDGTQAQYAILRAALARHPDLPVRLIPGDHDRQHGTIAAFDALFAEIAGSPRGGGHRAVPHRLPRPEVEKEVRHFCYAETVAGVRCLFVDMVSPGYGRKGVGLDFRIGAPQMAWLAGEIAEAAAGDRPCAVFLHAYPDDLRPPQERLDLAGLLWDGRVRLVEMGHTHYNELAHDGRTLYAAARSVGQNEDGSVGYAVAAIDGPVTSWRFRPLDRTAPFVLVTSPADRRLATRPSTEAAAGLVRDAQGRIRVRALVLSDREPALCRCRADHGPWTAMTRVSARIFEGRLPWPAGSRVLRVEAADPRWPGHGPDFVDADAIEPPAAAGDAPAIPERPGSDTFRIGVWPGKGVRGDQLGPNRAGRQW